MQRDRMKFKVHLVAAALLAAFVVSLVGIFVGFSQQRFQRVAESSAQGIFEGLADANATKLHGLIEAAKVQVIVDASLDAASYTHGPGGAALRAAMQAAVENDPALYGLYFGLANGDFVQAVAVRDLPSLRAALDAPPGTTLALRTIRRGEDGKRSERWQFLDAAHALLAERSTPASYDPTGRPWYALAREAAGTVVSRPYLFQSSHRPGVTVARRIAAVDGVVGADLSLETLNDFVTRAMAGRQGGAAMLDPDNHVLAYAGSPEVLAAGTIPPLASLSEVRNPYFAILANPAVLAGGAGETLLIDGAEHVFAVRSVPIVADTQYRVVTFSPLSAFDAFIRQARRDMAMTGALVLLFGLPLAYFAGRRASLALESLARDAERVQKLDFSGDVVVNTRSYEIDLLARAYRTMKVSIQERTAALELATDKLQSLVNIGLGLASQRDREALLHQILFSGKRLSGADAATLFLLGEGQVLRFALRSKDDRLPTMELPLYDPETGQPNERYVAVYAALRKETVRIDDAASETFFDMSGAKRFEAETGYRTQSMLSVPLVAASGDALGVLQLMNAIDPATGRIQPFEPELVHFVEALAAQAALAMENQRLLHEQRAMLDAMIRLIAGAIDAKSAYTGGHCERVPELALMLAEEASKTVTGPLAEFRFADEDAWREFRIGAWLHDCGKVTTPEYVVDKATKLETIYNRIHEVRTRFEVLWRDAEIARLEAVLGGADPAAAEAAMRARQASLQEDFAFVAGCNIGGEQMEPGQAERIARIAAETWIRHFDDRLGLSRGEMERRAATPATPPPAVEHLLADQAWHRVPRAEAESYDDRHRFQIDVPELLYDFGEVYNLCVPYGTLTAEERFKINEHIIQTIVMLENLPLPKSMARVPEYAGTHHETLAGTGYPRKLFAGQLSVPARIMAISDIFEALTAADRPYKEAKNLSESVAILASFAERGQIDPDLFRLFLSSGVYLRYAVRYLRPEQIDAVDIAPYLQ